MFALFVSLLVITFVLFLIGFWGRQLLHKKGGGERQVLRLILFLLLFALPLLSLCYIVLFVAPVPASLLATGFVVVAAVYGLVHSFYMGARRRREAYKAQQLSYLKQHIKAKNLEKQVSEWNKNYQAR